jgi:hypothetical protein
MMPSYILWALLGMAGYSFTTLFVKPRHHATLYATRARTKLATSEVRSEPSSQTPESPRKAHKPSRYFPTADLAPVSRNPI